MRELTEMLEGIERALQADAARRESASRVGPRAGALARRLPMVHRTGPPKHARSWLHILRERSFRAGEPGTARERALGIDQAVYFFLGCGAYPEGIVGFVLASMPVLARPSSFTPFDSGGLERKATPMDPARAATWDDVEKSRTLEQHLGAGADALDFAGPYLAAHFREPLDYVRRGQHSAPDYPPYHGLRSEGGDRRDWTIELQVHEDVPLGAGGSPLVEIVVGRAALLSDLPDDLLACARVAAAENEVLASIAEGIAATVVTASEGA